MSQVYVHDKNKNLKSLWKKELQYIGELWSFICYLLYCPTFENYFWWLEILINKRPLTLTIDMFIIYLDRFIASENPCLLNSMKIVEPFPRLRLYILQE